MRVAAEQAGRAGPALSVVMPTFNNERVLREAVGAWRRHGGDRIELIVVEDGCNDGTAAFLEGARNTPWGCVHLRTLHAEDAHELRCTNLGFGVASGELVAAWQDDMLLRAGWLVPELLATFAACPEIGLLSLSRGLDCLPHPAPIETWDELVAWHRLPSTIGPAPWNWVRIQEVDAVIRPWVVRRACLERVGLLDEAFRPTEWDEADLAFRIRKAGWFVATCGFERLGAYVHLGSRTTGTLSDTYKARVLKNGQLFHDRWHGTIDAQHARSRRTWLRRATAAGWMATARQAGVVAAQKVLGR